MASYTTNLNLKKPAGSEAVAIGDINNNMDTIDQAYGTLNSKSVKSTSFSGDIGSSGLVSLGVNGAGKVIVGIDVPGSIALPYKDSYNYWYAKIINVSTMQPVTSGNISGTVYYKD